MANRQIYELTSRTLATSDVLPTQEAGGVIEAGKNTVQDILNLITVVPTASYALNAGVSIGGSTGQIQYNNGGNLGGVPVLTYTGGTLNATGNFTGNLAGTATNATNADTASYIDLTAGPGITINGIAITASVRTVNGKFPTSNGNIETTLSSTKTGTSASLIVSSSGTITGSLADGLVWIVSNDPTPANNGLVYIYSSASVGRWYPIAPLDAAAIEAAYVRLDGTNGPMEGNLAFGGYNVTGVGTLTATTLQGNLTASYVVGPHGANSTVSASRAVTASLAVTASYALSSAGTAAFPFSGSALITGSLLVSGSGIRVTGSVTTDTTVRGGVVFGALGDGTAGTVVARTILPSNGVNYSIVAGGDSTIKAIFPYLRAGGQSGDQNDGTNTYAYQDLNIGYANVFGSTKAPSIKITRDASATVDDVAPYYTVISNNTQTTDAEITAGSGIWTANGRKHVLTVSTGSFLVRGGASLGINVLDQHYITGSVNVSGSITLNGSSITSGGGSAFPYNGDAKISGSLVVTGSIRTISDGDTDSIASYKLLAPSTYPLSPFYQQYNLDSTSFINNQYYQTAIPSIFGYTLNTATATAGGRTINTVFGHLGIGTRGYDLYLGEYKAQSLFVLTSGFTNANPASPVKLAGVTSSVVISDNNTFDITYDYTSVSNARTANGRTHVLTVTGSFLARDGVSLGLSASNQHYITGSVKVSGSVTVNDLITLQVRSTTPATAVEGTIMASGSAGSSVLYYYNGSTWNALF